ncbi:UTP--glucose-1-phosphate uridylyltransferase, partial [Akkermansiaceae bacterium]|nr:UTP--glucose-1-phosphate uridylyltransferase [Akkermansiaceae bacterium]
LVDALENLGVPSLIGADEISISGPVSFSDTVEVIGKVAFKNKGDSIEEIPAGVYQNESWSV